MIPYAVQRQEDVPGHIDWLHPSEQRHLDSLRFQKRRNDWLLGRWTAKKLLKEVWFPENVMQDIAILPGENRAPQVFLHGLGVDKKISISHSHGIGFCVTAPQGQIVGCDLEKLEQRSDHFYSDYFTSQESENYAKYRQLLSKAAYYSLLWSAKEAVMKALRTGLSLHPLKLEISAMDFGEAQWNLIRIESTDNLSSFTGHWQIEKDMVYVIVEDQIQS